MRSTPTDEAYGELSHAYDFYNRELYDGALRPCLLTLQRKGKRTAGYFAPSRFKRRSGEATDEIALNPLYCATCGLEEILQTVVHEMSHAWQEHFGKPGRRGYHNKEWAAKLKSVGLHPSSTGKPGGKETGEKMSDYVVPGGRFEQATAKLLASGFAVSWLEVVELAVAAEGGEGDEGEAAKPADKSNRLKYRCPQCSANAWGKRDLSLVCGKCRLDFQLA